MASLPLSGDATGPLISATGHINISSFKIKPMTRSDIQYRLPTIHHLQLPFILLICQLMYYILHSTT